RSDLRPESQLWHHPRDGDARRASGAALRPGRAPGGRGDRRRMKHSLQMLLRDWRAGELRVLAMALVVAVASITSVAFFADRVGRALVRDAHQLLGADLVLVSDHPWQAGIAEEIARRGLEGAQATTFISMAIAGDNSVLAGVKAVSANYPLRGRLRIASGLNELDAAAAAGPKRGTVWIEECLVTALETSVG